MAENNSVKKVSTSLLQKRWRKFKTLKRGYYSFLAILILYIISFIFPLFVGRNALLVKYNGDYYFPLFKTYMSTDLGQTKDAYGEANYRILNQEYKEADKGNWVFLPVYPFGPNENLLNELEGNPPHPPSAEHFAGTDDRGRDVFARLLYGFNIGISFALVVTLLSYIIGVAIGSSLGFYGGKLDIFGLRLIEIWSTLPFLYVIIIISSILQPNFLLLTFILTLFGWIGITYYMRGEFYREKARDYVSAAVSMGAENKTIIFKHILPNSLTPIISYAPFAIVANIFSLVSLDFLGFGLPPPTPSWGQLMQQGLSNIEHWWLIATPLISLFLTLLCITFIGEAIREAFDPKVYSRLR
ncbi:MAG: ABC transporter permease subunit [Ignavibacteria bacterium]|nr:ABC transporter permease subunit [Ignavibacteria bacterium]MBK7254919.1 ABC transporter permease subunit [Ignavibacteria bacterium]MBK7447120.1 ABC transporter permease subunit [Ignavibacteria bacterium]MBK8380817.1 ABC transporter permease subunit [Ignavibacteria bacterium]MBK9405820.1 ABC transporter permease subunit [Ignavibacteria bacterium]